MLVGTVLILSACGRAPISSRPSPSTDASTSPAAESPDTSTSPVGVATPPKASPTSRVLPSSAASPSSRTSPSLAPLVIAPPAFHVGEVSIVYSDVVLGATGGKPPYSWSVSSGALPGGLTLSTGGTLSGTPTTAGGFSFNVQVSDAASGAAGSAGSINIASYLSGNGICLKGCSVEAGCLTVCGTFAKPVGGVAPLKVSLASGPLPPGTTLGFPALSGQFTNPTGTYTIVVAVSDALGASITVSAIFTVFAHISIKGGTFTSTKFVPLTWSLPYSGGSGTPRVTITPGKTGPPPGMTAVVDPTLRVPSVVLTILDTTKVGSYDFFLTLTDGAPCGPGYNCSIRVAVTIVVQ